MYDQYWNQKKTIRTISKECGGYESGVLYYMNKYNIPRRDKDKMVLESSAKGKDIRYRNKDWLNDQYWNKRRSSYKIALMTNTHPSTIIKWLRKNSIKVRDNFESHEGLNQGKNNPSWRGGKWKNFLGYICVYKPEHPRAHQKYVYEHIIKAEEKLGRSLKNNEVVHHINAVKSNNRMENLYICTKSKHHKVHHSLTKLLPFLMKKSCQVKFDDKKGRYYINE